MYCSRCYWSEQCGIKANADMRCDDYTPLIDEGIDQEYEEAMKDRCITYEKIISSFL